MNSKQILKNLANHAEKGKNFIYNSHYKQVNLLKPIFGTDFGNLEEKEKELYFLLVNKIWEKEMPLRHYYNLRSATLYLMSLYCQEK